MNKKAMFLLAPELLSEALHLPQGTTIAYVEKQLDDQNIIVVVENDSFPEIEKGTHVPMIYPVIYETIQKHYRVDFKYPEGKNNE